MNHEPNEKQTNEIIFEANQKAGRVIYFDSCRYCVSEFLKGNKHFPPHNASLLCESGKRNHCTCDVCW
jgi:hypothetical protein